MADSATLDSGLTINQRAFLSAFRKRGIITHAAEDAGVDRGNHYRWLDDPTYAEAFEDAKEEAADILEAEARRRAVQGVREYQFTRDGVPKLHPDECDCGHHRREHELQDDGSGKTWGRCRNCVCQGFEGRPYFTHSYSDTLLIVGLKMSGRFVDRRDVNIAGLLGQIDFSQLPAPILARIAKGEDPVAVIGGWADEQYTTMKAAGLLESGSEDDTPVLESEVVEDGREDEEPDADEDGTDGEDGWEL